MPNVDNINTLIALLKGELADQTKINKMPFTMGGYAGAGDAFCRTAACLCGHVNFYLDVKAGGFTLREMQLRAAAHWRAAAWLGISDEAADMLFLLEGPGVGLSGLEPFDQFPAAERIHAAVTVLEHLRDTGRVDWAIGLRAIGRDPATFRRVAVEQVTKSQPLPQVSGWTMPLLSAPEQAEDS